MLRFFLLLTYSAALLGIAGCEYNQQSAKYSLMERVTQKDVQITYDNKYVQNQGVLGAIILADRITSIGPEVQTNEGTSNSCFDASELKGTEIDLHLDQKVTFTVADESCVIELLSVEPKNNRVFVLIDGQRKKGLSVNDHLSDSLAEIGLEATVKKFNANSVTIVLWFQQSVPLIGETP